MVHLQSALIQIASQKPLIHTLLTAAAMQGPLYSLTSRSSLVLCLAQRLSVYVVYESCIHSNFCLFFLNSSKITLNFSIKNSSSRSEIRFRKDSGSNHPCNVCFFKTNSLKTNFIKKRRNDWHVVLVVITVCAADNKLGMMGLSCKWMSALMLSIQWILLMCINRSHLQRLNTARFSLKAQYFCFSAVKDSCWRPKMN